VLSTRVLEFPIHLGLRNALSQLYDLGFRFTIVSTQQTATEDILWKYVRRHNLPIDKIHVTRTDDQKIKIVNAQDFIAFCDDNQPVLDQLDGNRTQLVWANFSCALTTEQPPYITVTTWKKFSQFAARELMS